MTVSAFSLFRQTSEEAQGLGAVAHQDVLGVLIVVEHHLVVFAADAGGLVSAERGMRRVGVIAIGPDPAGLDRTSKLVGAVAVAGPDAGAEPVQRVVGDFERVVL